MGRVSCLSTVFDLYLDTATKAWDVLNTLAFHPLLFPITMCQTPSAQLLRECAKLKRLLPLPSPFSELTQILSYLLMLEWLGW